MARRSTEAEQQRLSRYKQRRDEYIRELADSAVTTEPAGPVRDTAPPALPRRIADPSRPRPGRMQSEVRPGTA